MTSSNEYPEKSQPVEAWCDPKSLHVKLKDGREVITPLWWYPSLLGAKASQRNNVELMFDGVHWPDLDEDLSVKGMLAGWRYPDAVKPSAAQTEAEAA
ncbi:MAG: DUF2442 domain-containing protein [Ahrensia sp.]|nr:DUF2442 domain-containing protein [Ahrensia sp.]